MNINRAVPKVRRIDVPKQTHSAQVFVADGQGGMRPSEDHRLDGDDWPIALTVPAKAATDRMAHLDAECEVREWHAGGLSQHERDENGGSMPIETSLTSAGSSLQIAWEKERGERLIVRAHPGGTPLLGIDGARAFFRAVARSIWRGLDAASARAARLARSQETS